VSKSDCTPNEPRPEHSLTHDYNHNDGAQVGSNTKEKERNNNDDQQQQQQQQEGDSNT
jgi:hypothetical protein